MTKKQILIFILSIFLFGLIGSFYFRNAFLYLAAMITGNFQNVTYCLSVTFSGITVIILLLSWFKDCFVAEIKGNERLRFSITLIAMSAISLVLYVLSITIHFDNLAFLGDQYLMSIMMPLGVLGSLFIGIYSLITFKKERTPKDRPLLGMSKTSYVLLIFLALYAFYGVACFGITLEVLDNITIYAFGFIVLLYIFFLMAYNFIYINLEQKYKSNLLRYITIGANALGIILFVVAELIEFPFMVLIGKPYAPIDFAISIAFLPLFLGIMAVTMIAYPTIILIKSKKAK